ncbi:MAG TPA: hypothetical protein VNW46_13555, partial [Gemmatimonadaceae bacterium]|nr:hypothetical protein [Gemmatimonadaceae bacterium]
MIGRRALVIGLVAMPGIAAAQDTSMAGMPGMAGMAGMGHMTMNQAPLGIPDSRVGAGTSWLPDNTTMRAIHVQAGGWGLMAHYLAFGQYDEQFGRRGGVQWGGVNWGMLMATHALAGGQLSLRGMLSLDAATVTPAGYPLLLQSGEAYNGQPLHDRQHPHDLIMEAAAIYDHAVTQDLAVQLYVAPVGDPALGPVAYPHRPSAEADPFAPLAHHWEDATHVSFGVATVGVYTRAVKVEGSIFNGRDPDQYRYSVDYGGHAPTLDSYSGRVTVNPAPAWSLSGSYGYLRSPEQLEPKLDQHRATGSVLYGDGPVAAALIWGANFQSNHTSNGVTAEATVQVGARNTVFGRAEYVNKSAQDLDIPGVRADQWYDVEGLVAGYLRTV